MKKRFIQISVLILFIVPLITFVLFVHPKSVKGTVTSPSPSSTPISEDCYIQININERKISEPVSCVVPNSCRASSNPSPNIRFSLSSRVSLYGLYQGATADVDDSPLIDSPNRSVQKWKSNMMSLQAALTNIRNYYLPSVIGTSGDYTLNIYNTSGSLIKKYSLDTGRFVFYDSLSDTNNSSGITESNQGLISAIIPYQTGIGSIKIENKGIETNLGLSSSSFTCKITCKGENQTGNYSTDYCCSAFTPVTQPNGSFICVNCGNGNCVSPEDQYNCPADCGTITPAP